MIVPAGFQDDWRVQRLGTLLDVKDPFAVVMRLWSYCETNHWHAAFPGMDAEELAGHCRFDGDAGDFEAALIKLRFVEKMDEGGYAVPEFEECNAKQITKIANARAAGKKSAAKRSPRSNVTPSPSQPTPPSVPTKRDSVGTGPVSGSNDRSTTVRTDMRDMKDMREGEKEASPGGPDSPSAPPTGNVQLISSGGAEILAFESPPDFAPQKKRARAVKGVRVAMNTPLMVRIGAFFGRRPETLWTVEEAEHFGAVAPSEDEVRLLEWFYREAGEANEKNRDDPRNYRRKDLLVLLRHWTGERDKAEQCRAQLERSWGFDPLDPPEVAEDAAGSGAARPDRGFVERLRARREETDE